MGWRWNGDLHEAARSWRLPKTSYLDVWFYLKDILERLLAGETDYKTMLPDVWKQSHPEAVREHRAEERRDKAERKQYDRAKRLLDAKAKRAGRA